MTVADPVDQFPAQETAVERTPIEPTDAEPFNQAEPVEPEEPAGRTSVRSIMTLGMSICALAFLGWMIMTHHPQSLFGPAPSPQALAVSQPPPRPTGG